MKDKKGFTIIELLISLGLVSIVFSLVIIILVTNFISYKSIQNDAELQFQAQYILNFMSDKIIQSKYIELAKDNLVSHMNKTNEQKITKICFRYSNHTNNCYNFEVINDKIFYGNGAAMNSANVELGAYISEMYSCPIPEDVILKYAEAVKIKLKLIKDNQKYEAEQIVYMRNN